MSGSSVSGSIPFVMLATTASAAKWGAAFSITSRTANDGTATNTTSAFSTTATTSGVAVTCAGKGWPGRYLVLHRALRMSSSTSGSMQ